MTKNSDTHVDTTGDATDSRTGGMARSDSSNDGAIAGVCGVGALLFSLLVDRLGDAPVMQAMSFVFACALGAVAGHLLFAKVEGR